MPECADGATLEVRFFLFSVCPEMAEKGTSCGPGQVKNRRSHRSSGQKSNNRSASVILSAMPRSYAMT